MKKVKHILATFFHSFIPQDIYYPKLLHTRLSFSLKYYSLVMAFFALVFTGIVFYQFSPFKMVSYKNSIVTSLSSFPEEVRITIKNGILESNIIKPLFLWVYHDDQPLFVFMVHSKDILTGSRIPLPLLFMGIDRAKISFKGASVVRAYDNSWNVLITKERIQSFIAGIHWFFPYFIFFFYMFLIIIAPSTFILCLTASILLSSVLVYLLLRTFIPHIHLKKCIQASLHGTHIPLFITILLFALFPFAKNTIAIAVSLIFVFTLVSTYELYSKEPVHVKGR